MGRSERLNLVTADNHSWNLFEAKQVQDINGTKVLEPGRSLTGTHTIGHRHIAHVTGGATGNHMKISYEIFSWDNYDNQAEEVEEGETPPPTELQIELQRWSDIYGIDMSQRDFFAINVTIDEPGIGYQSNDIVSTNGKAPKNGAELVLKIATRNMGWQLSNLNAATKSFWENNYINPKGAPYVVRELMGTRQATLDISGHKFGGVHGWQYMFSRTMPFGTYKKYGVNATDTPGLQLMQDQCIEASAGVVFGNVLAHQMTQKQRWVIPKGISFLWDQRGSKKSSWGLQLQAIKLLFKLQGEKVTRYVSLIENKQFVTKGETLYANHLAGYVDANYYQGGVRAFMSDEEFQYLHDHGGKCIGTYIRYGNHKQGTFYDNVVNYFNYRFLFSEQSYSKSKMILPSPVTMDDSQNKGLQL